MKFLRALLVALLSSASQGLAATWTAAVDEREGLPAVSMGGGAAMSSSFGFWQKDWVWAGPETTFSVAGPLAYVARSKSATIGLDITARSERTRPNRLTWTFDLDAARTVPDAVGGGIVFNFDLDAFRRVLGEPELLPNRQGWAWGRPDGERIEMRFDPPLAQIFFERGRKNQIRAYFYSGGIPEGKRRVVATLDVLGGGGAIAPTLSERFGAADRSKWRADPLEWNRSPVDLSFLNAAERPAGKRGFLRSDGDRLVFEDGTPARFWGTNLTAGTLYGTSAKGIREQARRLSELGFNLVRLHHHDSPWVDPNIFGPASAPDTRTLDPAMVEKLDAWIKALKDEGIYVWLDLHVQRHFKAADGIEAFDEMRKGGATADLKGYSYVNPSVRAAMKRFNEAYVSHVNVHTGVAYKDEPAIVAMLITNENDVTNHFGNSLLPDKNVPWHTAQYMREAQSFARATGLPVDQTWRSWEHGASKVFLNDLERRFNVEMIAHLRAIGVKVPIATTSQWGNNALSSLPALTSGSLIDAHAYGAVDELSKNPNFSASFVHWLGAAQVAGKPMTVTEWNVEAFPAPDRHAMPLYVAGVASHQGLDALMQYAYAQVPLDAPHGPSNWHAFNDPAMIATLPAAGLLYRRGDVRMATTTYVFAPTREQLFNQSVWPRNSPALRTAMEKGRLVVAMPRTPELPWLEPSKIPQDAIAVTDPEKSFVREGAVGALSDTRELRRDWDPGTFAINTARTQAAMGWIGGRAYELDDVRIEAVTPNASVAVQSLSDARLGDSRRVLISFGARADPAAAGRMPYRVEPVEARLSVRAPPGLRLFADLNGPRPAREVPAEYRDGRYVIRLTRDTGTSWLLLRDA